MNRHARIARERGRYFTFPLCALAYGKTVQQRLAGIIDYGVLYAGHALWQRLDQAERNKAAGECIQSECAADFDSRVAAHVAFSFGARRLGIRYRSIRQALRSAEDLRLHVEEFETRHGPDPKVRLRTDLIMDARDQRGLTYDELAILAAIYSIIGAQQGPVLISCGRIGMRSLGYKSRKVYEQELPNRQDKAVPLSSWRLRRRLDSLAARKFFARATYGRRLTYFSHRMTTSALRKAVIDRKTHQMRHACIARVDDEAMTRRIRDMRAAVGHGVHAHDAASNRLNLPLNFPPSGPQLE